MQHHHVRLPLTDGLQRKYHSSGTSYPSRNLLPVWAGFFWRRLCADSAGGDDRNTSCACWAIPRCGKGEARPPYGAGSAASALAPPCSPASSPATAHHTHQRSGGVRYLLLRYPFNRILYFEIHIYTCIHLTPSPIWICRQPWTLRTLQKDWFRQLQR